MVLDGVADPSQDFSEWLAAQTVAIDAAMNRIFDGCGSGCPVDDAAATYDRVAAAVEVEPLPTGSDRLLGPSELATGAIFVSYDPSAWDTFYRALAEADDGDGGAMFFLDQAYEGFGAFTQYAAVECVDSPHPVGSEAFAAYSDSLGGAVAPLRRVGGQRAAAVRVLAGAHRPVAGRRDRRRARRRSSSSATPATPPRPTTQAVKVAETLLEQRCAAHVRGRGPHELRRRVGCVERRGERSYLVDLVTPTRRHGVLMEFNLAQVHEAIAGRSRTASASSSATGGSRGAT